MRIIKIILIGLVYWCVSIANANNNLQSKSALNAFKFPSIEAPTQRSSLPQSKPANLPPGVWPKIVKNINESRHHIEPASDTGLHKAVNLPNNLRINFNQNDVRITPRNDQSHTAWYVDLALDGFGYEGKVKPLSSAKVVATENRIEYQRGPLTEWYINDQRGLEQGFTLSEPPGQRDFGKLVVEIRGESSLRPVVYKGSSELLFVNNQEQVILSYGELHAWDADGKALPASLRIDSGEIGISSFQVALLVDDTGARYPVTVDPLIVSPEKKLVADDATTKVTLFGFSVSIHNDTLVVGAPSDNSAYIFKRNEGGGNWEQVKKITPVNGVATNVLFGLRVALSSDTAVVSTLRGPAYIFERNEGGLNNWGQTKQLNKTDDRAGQFVAIHDDTVIFGSSSGISSVYIFERDSGGTSNWGLVNQLKPTDTAHDEIFISSIAIDGNTLVFAENTINTTGSAYIFERVDIEGGGGGTAFS